MIYKRCWGGPLDGQIIPVERPVVYAPVFDDTCRVTEVLPESTTYHHVEYRHEKFAAPLRSAPLDRSTDPMFTEIYDHLDLPRNAHQWWAIWSCFIRDGDDATKTHILGGLRLIALLTGG